MLTAENRLGAFFNELAMLLFEVGDYRFAYEVD